MTTIIDGKKRANTLLQHYKAVTVNLSENDIYPKLVVITVGDDDASKVYVGQKEKKAQQIGIDFEWITLDGLTDQKTLDQLIVQLNQDPSVSGMIVQLPLPKQLDEKHVKAQIEPLKDVDGFHPYNIGQLVSNDAVFIPCTPKGILNLMKYYDINPQGKNITIVGRSQIVGLPLSILLTHLNGTVTVCHTRTPDLKMYTQQSDIVISAAGVEGMITADHIKDGAVVIDVGINRRSDGKLVGDVVFDEVSAKASAITPVPGGVGPMTVAMLLEQTIMSACLQHERDPQEFLGSD